MMHRLFAMLLIAGTTLRAEVCATLLAQIASRNGHINPVDETHLDTARIQQALDHCAAGRTLRLAVLGSKNAFLSGPLQMRSSVTLTIGEGVTLFASRDARLFQVKPGSCGVVDDKGAGCNPLLSCKNAADAGVTGEGIIDGRSNATILGETFSWQDLAQEAHLKNGKLNAPRLLDQHACPSLRASKVKLRNDADALF